MRISNPQALVDENIRVQNEVAAMSLMRQALSSCKDRLISDTSAWSPSSEGREWILQEYMRGTQLDKDFGDLDSDCQRDIVHQIADVFKLIQEYRLPDSVIGYGGLCFNDSGDIVPGPKTIDTLWWTLFQVSSGVHSDAPHSAARI